MTGPVHDRAQLGAYALGALDPVEARQVHEHLAGCPDCQRELGELMMIRRALDQVPPEAFVDGPPEDGQLLLQRTLRRVRVEAPQQPRRRSAGLAVAAAVAVAVALGGGIYLGRTTAPSQDVAAPPSTTTSTPTNARFASGTDAGTGAEMQVAVEPKKGWVWLHVDVKNLPVDEPCEIYVIPKDGPAVLTGSWKVSEEGSKNGTRLEGTADIPPDQVESVEVRTADGDVMINVPI
jgi:hypothetical protein